MDESRSHELTDNERIDWLRLIRSENVGPVTFHKLLARFGSASAALDALPDLARRGGRRNYQAAPKDCVAREIDASRKLGQRLVAWCEPDYPPILRALDDAPPVLGMTGHTHLGRRRGIAIVGARNATANGKLFARKLAVDIGAARLAGEAPVVVSGLARGIDTAAHEGALENGTIAVIAGGIDHIYPPENEALHHAIAERGLIVAEQPVGTQPRGRLFPLRNRLISGLALGVVVVEASPKSGSLITARCALDQGREVFAVPGAPGDPRTAGANGLIRDGAVLTENASDVLNALPSPDKLTGGAQIDFDFNKLPSDTPSAPGAEDVQDAVLENLGFSSVTVDELARSCQLSLPSVQAALLELELAGRLERLPGSRVQLLRTE